MSNRGLHIVTFTLMVIGGLNWLLWGLFGWEVGQLFGGMDAGVSRVIYIVVGLATVYELAMHGRHCRACKPEMAGMPHHPVG